MKERDEEEGGQRSQYVIFIYLYPQKKIVHLPTRVHWKENNTVTPSNNFKKWRNDL